MEHVVSTESPVAVVEHQSEAATPRSKVAPPSVATRMHILQPVAVREGVIGPVSEDSLPSKEETGFIGSSAAFENGDPLLDRPKVKEVKSAEAAPKGQAAGTKEQPELLGGKFKTIEDVLKSYGELEARYTQSAQELAQLKKPTPVEQHQVVEAETWVIDPKLADELYSNPTEAVKKIIELAEARAVKAIDKRDSVKSRETQVSDVRTWFTSTHADLAANVAAMQAIEGLAAGAEGSTMLDKFQNATKSYLGLVKAAAEKGKLDAAAVASATESLVVAAGMPENRKGSGDGKKVWKQSDIDWLMGHDRSRYQELAKEIAQARKEGRVREDL